MRGVTIRIDRQQAMRALGEVMRTKTVEFEQAKRQYPAKLKEAKRLVLLRLHEWRAAIRNGITSEKLRELCGSDLLAYKERYALIPSQPELNLCREKQLLLMLQNDVRKVIPINSNHELWAMLQGKCEPLKSGGEAS